MNPRSGERNLERLCSESDTGRAVRVRGRSEQKKLRAQAEGDCCGGDMQNASSCTSGRRATSSSPPIKGSKEKIANRPMS